MFPIREIAPDIVAMMEAHAEHVRECRAETCERCGKYPAPPLQTDEEIEAGRRREWAGRALSTIPRSFAEVTLATPWLAQLVGAQAIAEATQAVRAPRAAFLGPAGAGKTSLAVAMFRALLEVERPDPYRRAEHRYVSAHALAKARAMHTLGDGEAPLVEASLRAPLLLVDELGGEDARHASAVAEVIYERHAEGLPTWITTGVLPKDLANRYGGGIARRLFEGATIFRLAGRRA